MQIYKKGAKKDKNEGKNKIFQLSIVNYQFFFVPLHPLFGVTDGGKSRVARLCCVGTIQQFND